MPAARVDVDRLPPDLHQKIEDLQIVIGKGTHDISIVYAHQRVVGPCVFRGKDLVPNLDPYFFWILVPPSIRTLPPLIIACPTDVRVLVDDNHGSFVIARANGSRKPGGACPMTTISAS